MTLSPTQLATLRALLDRLIPADDFPGALAAGTENYLVRQLAGDCAPEAPLLARGLDQLDVETSARHPGIATYRELAPPEQDALLTELERGRTVSVWPAELKAAAFFTRLVDLAHEGFYADPANGGNAAGASWQMLGYATRTTPPGTPPSA